MHVLATAGHVDHGKSTLVRALTGMEPDRWAEERSRGMTIDLGFAWTTLPSGERVAFVDVPGHERFVANMLAGVGPVPAVMLVVAADEGWMPQTDEHVQAVAALGAQHLVLVIAKADLASPDVVAADAHRRLAAAGFDDVPWVAVSAADGRGLDELRGCLDAMVARLPRPQLDAPVRLWVDRAFTIRGAGTVVTGTLPAGRIRVGDTLQLLPGDRDVVVRGLQSMQQDLPEVAAVARVAVNLRGVDRDEVRRGIALVTPHRWTPAVEMDVVLGADDLPEQLVAHIGSAAVPARTRRLGPTAARLRLAAALPLHLGDRLLLRDPASRRTVAADVADLRPPPLRRRGDPARIAARLRVPTTADEEVARRGICTTAELVAAGLDDEAGAVRRVGQHLVAAPVWASLRATLTARVAGLDALDAGLPLPTLARDLGAPSVDVVVALAAELPDVVCVDGRIRSAANDVALPPGVQSLVARLRAEPFRAPDATELDTLGLTPAGLAHAVRGGLLLRLADGVYLAGDAVDRAVEVLEGLPAPFTVADARTALGSTRRVVVPLLEHLDAARRTRRQPDGTRFLVGRAATVKP